MLYPGSFTRAAVAVFVLLGVQLTPISEPDGTVIVGLTHTETLCHRHVTNGDARVPIAIIHHELIHTFRQPTALLWGRTLGEA